MDVRIRQSEPELFACFPNPVGDRFGSVVVASDRDVGVVGPVEGVPARGLLLQPHPALGRVDRQCGEGAVPQPLLVGMGFLGGAAVLVAVGEDVDQRHDAPLVLDVVACRC